MRGAGFPSSLLDRKIFGNFAHHFVKNPNQPVQLGMLTGEFRSIPRYKVFAPFGHGNQVGGGLLSQLQSIHKGSVCEVVRSRTYFAIWNTPAAKKSV
jgi:hypothetical protein